MRPYPLALVATLLLCLVGDHAVLAQNPPCDPDRDRRNPALERAKEAKKADLRRRGYPERFMKLIDQEQCIACVREASDAFHIMIVYKDNAFAPKDPKTGRPWTHISFNWDPESELIAREKTKDGTIKGFYILNTTKRDCRCCPDIDPDKTRPEDYSDWDEDLGANKGQLIPFDQSNLNGPLPDDLTNPNERWVGDPIPTAETFTKPPKKQAHATCPSCAADAQKLNDAYDAIDALWDQKIALLDEGERLKVADAKRQNEIRLMWYKQRSSLTSSPEIARQIDEAEKASEIDIQRIRQIVRDVAALDTRIADAGGAADALAKALVECEAKCRTTVTETNSAASSSVASPPKPTPATPPAAAANVVSPPVPPRDASSAPPPPVASCFGDSCADEWSSCTANDTCAPVETDCGIPGNCTANPVPGPPVINLIDPPAWTTSINVEIEIRVQDKLAEFDPLNYPQYQNLPLNESVARPDTFRPYVVIPPIAPIAGRAWFNPLGLLARTISEHVDRWRASVGPRPIITTRDLETIDRVSNAQAAGLPVGVHVMLMDQGGSTGKTLTMQILNLSGRPVRLASKPFAVQPIRQQAQQQVMQAFGRLSKAAPVNLSLSAYCVEMLKAPPGPSTLLRLAPANVQQKYAAMSKVLQSGYRVAKGNALHPDSNPAAYADSIKQWSLWALEQNFNEKRFTDAFIAHTKKNVEAAGQKWSPQAEDQIRKAAPNRWRDIVTVLRGSGVEPPR